MALDMKTLIDCLRILSRWSSYLVIIHLKLQPFVLCFSSSSCVFINQLTEHSIKPVWWSGVVVSTLALINEVNLRRARLVLRWVTVSGSIPGAGHLFQYVTNQPPKANSAFHPSGVAKWVPASAGNAKAGMVHSVSGWMWGVRSLENACHT